MRIQESMTMYEKLNILTDAAKYDVACTSSGTARANDGTGMAAASRPESAIVFRRMGGVSLFLRFFIPMNASMTANTASTGGPMMSGAHLLRQMKCARLPWSFTGAIILRGCS